MDTDKENKEQVETSVAPGVERTVPVDTETEELVYEDDSE